MAENPPPLAIGCKASRCGKDVPAAEQRHAFSSPSMRGLLPGFAGGCEACEVTGLIDWERCHVHEPADLEALTESLRFELIRDNYWGLALPEHILRKARKRSSEQLQESIELNLRSGLRLGNPREGRQTPWAISEEATIIDCAKHGTGTCCRRCLEKWHGYEADVELSPSDIEYLGGVLWSYTERRLEASDIVGGQE